MGRQIFDQANQLTRYEFNNSGLKIKAEIIISPSVNIDFV